MTNLSHLGSIIYDRISIDTIMPQKPDGVIYIDPHSRTITFHYGKKVYSIKQEHWHKFLGKFCVDITSSVGKKGPGGSRFGYSTRDGGYTTRGNDPTEHGISEKESIDRLFRD